MSITTIPQELYESKLIHKVNISFDGSCRDIKEIHLMQYDISLPIVEISMFINGQPYILPDDAECNIRYGELGDSSSLIASIRYCDSTRTKLYMEVSNDMTRYNGRYNPIIELIIDEEVAGSTFMHFIVEKNPVSLTYVRPSSFREVDLSKENPFVAGKLYYVMCYTSGTPFGGSTFMAIDSTSIVGMCPSGTNSTAINSLIGKIEVSTPSYPEYYSIIGNSQLYIVDPISIKIYSL